MTAPQGAAPFLTTSEYFSIESALADAEAAAIALTDAIRDSDGLFVDPAAIELLAWRARKLIAESRRVAGEAGV